MDIIGANRHNNNENDIYNNAVNIAIHIKNQLQLPNQLPPHCNLVLHNENLVRFETLVLIEFTNPHSNHTGHILIGDAAYMARNDAVPNNGYVYMLCSISAFNGYFMEITVNNLVEMLEVVAFCQNLLEYQPDEQFIEYVHIPEHLLNHWCVPQHLRRLNANANEEIWVPAPMN